MSNGHRKALQRRLHHTGNTRHGSIYLLWKVFCFTRQRFSNIKRSQELLGRIHVIFTSQLRLFALRRRCLLNKASIRAMANLDGASYTFAIALWRDNNYLVRYSTLLWLQTVHSGHPTSRRTHIAPQMVTGHFVKTTFPIKSQTSLPRKWQMAGFLCYHGKNIGPNNLSKINCRHSVGFRRLHQFALKNRLIIADITPRSGKIGQGSERGCWACINMHII
jgi:hypothetical protein